MPSAERLAVVISGKHAGTLQSGIDGMRFDYERAYDGPNLSVAMPHQASAYDDAVTRPVFDGLLPDGEAVRATMARRIGASSADTMGLLAEYGKDLPGAVQVCPEGELQSVLAAEGSYVPIANSEIAQRLKDAISEIGKTYGHITGMSKIAESMLRAVDANCATFLANIDATHGGADFRKPNRDLIYSGTLPQNGRASDFNGLEDDSVTHHPDEFQMWVG